MGMIDAGRPRNAVPRGAGKEVPGLFMGAAGRGPVRFHRPASPRSKRFLFLLGVLSVSVFPIRLGAAGPSDPGKGAVRPTVVVLDFIPSALHASIRAGSDRTDLSSQVQAAIDACLEDSGRQDFAARGRGPRGRGTVTFPPGTYHVRNVLLRSGVDLHLPAGATVRLCDNTVDSSMRPPYPPSNVFCTTRDHTGNYEDPRFGPQRWFQGSASGRTPVISPDLRAGRFGTQSEFIVENVRIYGGGTIDGNRAGNTLGDQGENASAMGSCVCLHQARNVTISGVTIRNARMDGVSMGYTLHGGTYASAVERCTILDSGRNAVSLLTGWRNRVDGNVFERSGGSDVDIEGNWDGEVNALHRVNGNRGTGAVAIAAKGAVRSNGCRIEKNRFRRLHLYPRNAQGSVIEGNRFVGEGGEAAITVGGPDGIPVPIEVRDNVFENHARIFAGTNGPTEGTHGALRLTGNIFRNP